MNKRVEAFVEPSFSLKTSIVRKLLTVIFSIYFCITLIITCIHMYIEYNHVEKQVHQELSTFESILKPILIEALWNIDEKQIASILDGARNNPMILGATVESSLGHDLFWKSGYYLDDNRVLHFFDPASKKDMILNESQWVKMHILSFDLNYIRTDGVPMNIGKATFYSSNEVVLDQVFFGFFLLLFNAFIKTIALWVFFFWAGYLYLTRPLWQLTRAVDKVRQGKLAEAQVPVSAMGATELDVLAKGLNSMTHTLEQTQQRLQGVINAMPSVLITISASQEILDWNQGAVLATHIPPETAIGQALKEVYPVVADHLSMMHQAYIKQYTQILEDEPRYFDMMVYPLKIDGQIGAVIRIDDVTQRVLMEHRMIQSEKMSSIGNLAAGMAHEINNPLGAILQGAQNVLRRMDPQLLANQETARQWNVDLENMSHYCEQRKITAFIHGIQEAGERAANIVTNLLQFSRRPSATRSWSLLSEVFDKALELAKTDYFLKKHMDFKHIAIEYHYEAALPLVHIEVMEIEQVFLNILRNAAQAMIGSQPNPRIIVRMYVKDRMLYCDISDNGPGMSEHTKSHLFEPFFTTKPVGMGTGLGLSVSYSMIVDSHKGTIEVDSLQGSGTTFTIGLPIDPEHTFLNPIV